MQAKFPVNPSVLRCVVRLHTEGGGKTEAEALTLDRDSAINAHWRWRILEDPIPSMHAGSISHLSIPRLQRSGGVPRVFSFR